MPAPYEPGHEVVAREHYYPYPDYALQEPEGTDWGHIAGLLWQRKWWILAALALGIVAGYLGARFATPVYEATTTVWVEETDDRGGAIRAGDVLGGAGWANIFRSYAVMVPVAREERLYLRVLEPRPTPGGLFDGFELTDDLVPGLYEYREDPSGGWTLSRPEEGTVESGSAGEPVGETVGFRWTPPAGVVRPGASVRFQVTTPRNAALAIWNRLHVDYDSRASLITATLRWPEPDETARILNALAAQFIEVATDLKSRKIREETAILEEQTQFISEELEEAELALESHKIAAITLPSENNVVPAPGGQGVRDPVFGAYFDRRLEASQLQADLRQIEAVLADLRSGNEANLIALRFIPSLGSTPELAAALEDLQAKEVERRTLLYRYTEEWPEVQRLEEEIRGLRTGTIPRLLADVARQLRERLGAVEGQIAAQAGELRQIPSRTIEEMRRQRETELHADLYNDLKVRLNNARLSEATAELADMQVVDEAVAPRQPLEDQGPRILLLASMAGLGIGIAGVLVHDKLDRRIRSPGQVTRQLGLPVLGVVPRLNGKKDPSGATAAVAIEAFRGIRTQLARAGGGGGKLTMVTSPAPREGKSMVSANLAISWASSGQRTVLLDGDTRRGRAQDMFGGRRGPGLTDFLLERATLDDVLQETGVENLWLLARGSSEGYSADRLDSSRMDELLAALEDRFDVVVIDAPPLAAGADALLLGERVDKVLLVVRAGTTDEALARTKLDMVGNVELHIVGTVLNAVPESAPYYEQYVHYYYADAEIPG